MNIQYCETCGVRITEESIRTGQAVPVGENQFSCSACVAKSATASTSMQPAHPNNPLESGRRSTTVAPRPVASKGTAIHRAPHAPAAGRQMGPIIAAAGVASLVLAGVIVFMSRSKPAQPEPKTENRALIETPSGGTKVETPAKSEPPTAAKKTEPSIPSFGAATPEPESPRDAMAARQLQEIREQYRTSQDPYNYAERLAHLIDRNRSTPAGREAAQELGQLKLPSRIGQAVARWKLDESNNSTTAADSVRGGAATLVNATWAAALGSAVVETSGQENSYVDLGAGPELNFPAGGAFTICGWVRTQDAAGPVVSFRHRTMEGPVIAVAVGNDGRGNQPGTLMAVVRDNSNAELAHVMGKPVNDGNWHHFALARNSQGAIHLYVDGEGFHSSAAPGSAGAIDSDWRSLGAELYWIRAGHGGPDERALAGQISDVRVYRVALSAPEIKELIDEKSKK